MDKLFGWVLVISPVTIILLGMFLQVCREDGIDMAIKTSGLALVLISLFLLGVSIVIN